MLIYKIINDINDKMYVGQSIKSLEHRWKKHLNSVKHGSKYHFHNAIRKHGPDCWTREIIEEIDDIFADEREKYWIAYYDTYKNGYNQTEGGEGFKQKHTEKSKDQMSISQRKRFETEDIWNKGKEWNSETKAKMSKSRLGKEPWNKGKKMTQEYRENISKSLIGNSRRKGKIKKVVLRAICF